MVTVECKTESSFEWASIVEEFMASCFLLAPADIRVHGGTSDREGEYFHGTGWLVPASCVVDWPGSGYLQGEPP